jgi:hypothetical protein
MKPKEYIKKYNLGVPNATFSHNAFIADFANDFLAVVEFHSNSNNWNYTIFKNCITEVRRKWDAISNKMHGTGLPDKLWNYFYATVVVKTRDEFFGEYLKQKEEKYRERKRFNEEMYGSFRGFGFNFFFEYIFSGFMRSLGEQAIPTESFNTLNLTIGANIEEVKNAYRELAVKHHPDKGGDAEMFNAITQAKNKCIAYLEREKVNV